MFNRERIVAAFKSLHGDYLWTRMRNARRNDSRHNKIYPIQAVIFQQREWWVAQCLEYDIATQAKTPVELYRELARVLTLQVELDTEAGREPFQGIDRAPDKFWSMFATAELTVSGRKLSFRIADAGNGFRVRPRLRIAEMAAA